jgi:hypothetical protein
MHCSCLFALVFLSVFATPSQAQGVYVTPGEKGPVFSDKPQPGSRELPLKPLNVMNAPPPSPVSAKVADKPVSESEKIGVAVSPYRHFSVLSPENDGSVVANTAIFEVRLMLDPPLQLGDGHAFRVSINGRDVGQRFTATEFMIPPEFWGSQIPPANQSMQLDARIVDGNDAVLKKAEAVRFFLRYVTILNPAGRPLPKPFPPIPPARPISPKPKAEPESLLGVTKPSN